MEIEIKYTTTGMEINDTFISLEDITTNVRKCQEAVGDLVLMTITWHGDRVFDGAKEKIVLNADNARKLKAMIVGTEVQFGEIAGKHSDISGELEDSEIIISNNAVEFLSECPNGHEYNHSFLHTIMDCCSWDEDANYTQEDIQKLLVSGV